MNYTRLIIDAIKGRNKKTYFDTSIVYAGIFFDRRYKNEED